MAAKALVLTLASFALLCAFPTPVNAAPACFTIHARLQVGNGTPAARLWPVNTHRLLGVHDGPPGRELDTLPANVRRILDRDQNARIYGNYRVCPLTAEHRGRMRMVRISRAEIQTVVWP